MQVAERNLSERLGSPKKKRLEDRLPEVRRAASTPTPLLAAACLCSAAGLTACLLAAARRRACRPQGISFAKKQQEVLELNEAQMIQGAISKVRCRSRARTRARRVLLLRAPPGAAADMPRHADASQSTSAARRRHCATAALMNAARPARSADARRD